MTLFMEDEALEISWSNYSGFKRLKSLSEMGCCFKIVGSGLFLSITRQPYSTSCNF